MRDVEWLEALFRAAHSIKGSAAMLRLEDISHLARYLEDSFHALRNGSQLDEQCLPLFEEIARALETAIEQIAAGREEPFAIAAIERTAGCLQARLASSQKEIAPVAIEGTIVRSKELRELLDRPAYLETSALQLVFCRDIPTQLQQMQAELVSEDRFHLDSLQNFFSRLLATGDTFDLDAWCALVAVSQQALSPLPSAIKTIPPPCGQPAAFLLQEIDRATQAVAVDRATEIQPSKALLDLLTWNRETAGSYPARAGPPTSQVERPLATTETTGTRDATKGDAVYGKIDKKGPEVGAEELKSLDDLFKDLSDLEPDDMDGDGDRVEEPAETEGVGDLIDLAEVGEELDVSGFLDGDRASEGDEELFRLLEEVSAEEEQNEIAARAGQNSAVVDPVGDDLADIDADALDDLADLLQVGAEPAARPEVAAADAATPEIEALDDLFDSDPFESQAIAPTNTLSEFHSNSNLQANAPIAELEQNLAEEEAFEDLFAATSAESPGDVPVLEVPEELDDASAFADLLDFSEEDASIEEPAAEEDFDLFGDGEDEVEDTAADTAEEAIAPPPDPVRSATEAESLEENLWADAFDSDVDADFDIETDVSAETGEAIASLPDAAPETTEEEGLWSDAFDSDVDIEAAVEADVSAKEVSFDSLFDETEISDGRALDGGDLELEEDLGFEEMLAGASDGEALDGGDLELDGDLELEEDLGFEEMLAGASDGEALEGTDLELEENLGFEEAFAETSDREDLGLEEELGFEEPISLQDDVADAIDADAPEDLEEGFGLEDLFGTAETPAEEAWMEPAAEVPKTIAASTEPTDIFSDLAVLLGETAPAPSGAFAELDALLGLAPLAADRVAPAPASESMLAPVPESPDASDREDDDFAELEKIATAGAQGMDGSPSRRARTLEQTMRVAVRQLDNLSNLVGELVVNRNSLEDNQERLRQFLDNLLHQVQLLSDAGQRMQDVYEMTLVKEALRINRFNRSGSVPQQNNDSSAGDWEAEEMDRFNVFHELAQEIIEHVVRVKESSSDIEFLVENNEQVTRQLRQVTNQLQEGLTRSRMVPFSQNTDRLPRGVKENARKFGKQVELIVEGQDTLIDKMLVDKLSEPMTHLVNNAIAHGIELPEERERQGKEPAGKITVRAFHQGNQTVISVSDDGAGINHDKVREKAVQKGLVTAEQARNLSRLDIYDLLFLPGFSTRDRADALAGRGVGMDVVRTCLAKLRGTIVTDSSLGHGTSFTIRLPLTLSISRALCCVSDRYQIAFPLDGVEDTIDLPKDRIFQQPDGTPFIQWRDMRVPFKPLKELLVYNRHIGRSRSYTNKSTDEDIVPVIVLRSARDYLAIEVDQVMGEQEIVVKQLEGPVPKPAGIAGATVMGDGRILAIGDVLELIDLASGRRREAVSALWDDVGVPAESSSEKTEPLVLIVDDSITVRELLKLTFIKAGYRVEQARDGQDAWDQLRAGLDCDIVFCDIEMPRMDGLELLSRMQKDNHLKQVPIAMLTSRGADRHRQMAVQLGARGYFTKPYLEEALLEAASRMLKGEVLVS